MLLKNLISSLKAEQDRVLPFGFTNPHSYRGSYHELAVEPKANMRIADMVQELEACVDTVFQGYKGGNFKMSEYTDVWLANYGCVGETLGPSLLGFMLGVPAEELCKQAGGE